MKIIRQIITAAALLVRLANLLTTPAFAADSNQITEITAPVKMLNSGSSEIEKTLREFVKLAAADQELGAFLSKSKLMIEYRISDSELKLHLGFDGAKIVSAFGQAPHPAELSFASDARTLDRVLRGGPADSKFTTSIRLSLARKIGLARNREMLLAQLSRVYAQANANISGENKATLITQNNSH